MASSDECVKHAGFISCCVVPVRLLARANLHQKHCVNLIGKVLNDLETYSPGNEDAVLAAIVILAHNEV